MGWQCAFSSSRFLLSLDAPQNRLIGSGDGWARLPPSLAPSLPFHDWWLCMNSYPIRFPLLSELRMLRLMLLLLLRVGVGVVHDIIGSWLEVLTMFGRRSGWMCRAFNFFNSSEIRARTTVKLLLRSFCSFNAWLCGDMITCCWSRAA